MINVALNSCEMNVVVIVLFLFFKLSQETTGVKNKHLCCFYLFILKGIKAGEREELHFKLVQQPKTTWAWKECN